MAKKADVQFVVGSDAEKAVSDLQKLVSKHEELLAKTKAGNEEGKKGKGIWHDMGKEALTFAAGIATGETAMKALSFAVQSVKRDFEDLIIKQKEAGQAVLDVARNSIRAAGIGNIGNVDELQKEFVRKSAAFGVPTAQFAGAYTNYRVAALSNQSDTMAAASRVAKFNDIVDTGQTSQIAGRLKYAVPGLTPEQSVNLAIRMTEQSRGDAGKVEGAMMGLQQLQEGGVDPNTALALSMGFIEKGLPSRSLSTVAGMVVAPMDTATAGFGKSLTEKQKVQNEYAALSPQDRIAWLAQNPSKAAILFGTQAAKLAPALGADVLAAGQSAVAANMTNTAMDALLTQSIGPQQFAINELADRAEVVKEQIKLAGQSGGTTGLSRESVNAMIDTMPGQWGSGLNWASRAFTKTRLSLTDYMGGTPYMQGAEEYLAGQYKGGGDALNKAILEMTNALHELNRSIRQQQYGPRINVMAGE